MRNAKLHPIKVARQKLGLTQREIAEAAGVTNATISRIEARRFNPEPAVAIKLANALGLTLDQIYGRAA